MPENRQTAVALLEEAPQGGARLERACAELGLSVRTYPRWTAGEALKTDVRPPALRPLPAHKLRTAARAQVLARCHEPA